MESGSIFQQVLVDDGPKRRRNGREKENMLTTIYGKTFISGLSMILLARTCSAASWTVEFAAPMCAMRQRSAIHHD